MEKLKELNELKHTLIDAVKMEVAKGIDNVDTEELGEVVDMIKDLAEAEEACMEACYYELVSEAMDGGESEKMGYDRWRYSSGRFAPKGRGTYGYLPPYMGETLHAEPMGYTDNRTTTTRTNGSNGTMTTNGRMGNVRYGYSDDPKEQMDEAIETMSSVWSGADADLRKKMKSVVQDLLYQMEQN